MRIHTLAVAALIAVAPTLGHAADKVEQDKAAAKAAAESGAKVESFEIIMKNHEFSPVELVVPADKPIKIVIKNQDSAPIEFESVHLNREKIIQPNGEATLNFGPLKAGTYRYRDDFNENAKGFITVK